MDKLRIALMAALAFISLMLVVEFAQFKDDKNKQRLLSQQSSTSTTKSSSSDFSDRSSKPVLDNQSAIDSGDVPTLNAIESSKPQPEPVVENTHALIEVSTDTFFIKIDPRGGDLIQVSLAEHLARIDTPNIPFTLLENSSERTNIAQSGLIGQNGTDSKDGRPLFSSQQKTYTMSAQDDQLVVDLNLKADGVSIIKRFTFERSSYLIAVDYIIDNQAAEPWQAAFYAQIKRDGSKAPSSDGGMGMQPYLGFAVKTADERFKKIDFEDVQEEAFQTQFNGGWIAMIQHYFLSAWIPAADQENQYSTLYSRSGFNIARVKTPLSSVESGQQQTISASFYAGPKDQYKLESISEGLDLSVDYGFLWMVAQPLYALLYFFNEGSLHAFGQTFDVFSGVANWGFSIILLTILVKALFFGLNKKAYTSMAKMRAIQPKMLEIKDRYAEDRQKQSQEMMKLYSSEGVNPIGGCLPMIVQMPVFIALYWVLLESVELRHAPFIGYINDLSAMDPYFIMPLIMGASMWVQQRLNPAPPDPMQAKVMQFLPVIFTFFFLFFPSGLVLYWIVNNLLTITQQWVITRAIEKAAVD